MEGEPLSDARVGRLERQLAVIQEISHIGIWQWDLGTNEVSWSDELYRIYGLAPQSRAITLEVFLAFLHEEDRERVLGEVRGAVERCDRFHYRERIVRGDGSVRLLDTRGEVEPGPDGGPRVVVGTCRDITEARDREATIRLYQDIVENVEIGLSVWTLEDVDDARHAKLVSFNAACETAVGSRWAVGQELATLLPALVGTPLLDAVAALARGATVRPAPYPLTLELKNRAFSVMAFPLPDGAVGLALEDISAQVHARALQDAEQRVLEQIASGAPLPEVLTSLVLAIEELAPPAIASILLLDETGTRIRHGAAPHLPEGYNQAIDGQPIGPRAGSCGTAAYERRTVFVTDIEVDPLWDDYREIARRHSLRTCWSQPILATDGRVLGTFALYYREPRVPDEHDRDLIARATHVGGIAIHRREIDDQLRALSARADAVREEERTTVAREIHDQLGQALTALKMDIAWIGRRLRADAEPEAIHAKLEAMSRMTDGIIDDVRRISAELRPGVLDDLGLVAAIEWQASEFEERTGTTCVVRADVGSVERFERNLSTAVFRIFQEALTNVARHAEASHVEVVIRCEGGRLALEVRDDGKGIPDEAITSPSSLGLLGMRERARRLGGSITLERDGQGTVFAVEVPLGGRP